MSWNSGAGSPNYFRCSQCRKTRNRYLAANGRRAEGVTGFIGAVRLTGRTKERKTAHRRNGTTLREYRCTDCGHVGWSSHNDLARALPLTLAFHAGHRHPIPVESTFGTDAVFPKTDGLLVYQGVNDTHISEFTGKQKVNVRPRGKRK